MAQPSLIPVPISKRSSVSLNPGTTILQQSTNSVNSQGRSPSPLATKNGKRLSIYSGNGNGHVTNGHGPARKLSTDADDPAQLKAKISKLEGALQAAHARMAEDCRGAGIDASMSLSSPTPGSPLPWTPTNGTLRLPEIGLTPGEGSEDEALDQVHQEPQRRLPKSNSNFDLRTAAATPRESRGLSQIPRAAVHNALSLHPSPRSSPLSSPHADSPTSNGQASPSLYPSALRKTSGSASSASTRVIDNLQTELLNTRGHLERVKSEVRACQRVTGSLGREVEDLKETRERLKRELETANNLTSRKERMLADVLERAQKAEAQVALLNGNQKELEQTTKKSLAEMTTQLAEAQRKESKAESESSALKAGVVSMKDAWAREVKSLRTEVRKTDERWKGEHDEVRAKNQALLKLVQNQSADRTSVLTLLDKSAEQHQAARQALEAEIVGLKETIDKSADESRQANEIAIGLQIELAHLRRLMREPRRSQDLAQSPNAV